MMDLSKDALALLDSARHADAAPHLARQRVRRRLVHAIAVGTIGTSTAVAKGAALSALGGAKAGAAVGASASITTGFIGAVVTGLALGMVALAPASKRVEEPVIQPPAAVFGAPRTTPTSHSKALAPVSPATSSKPVPLDEQPAPSAAAANPMRRGTEVSNLRNRDDGESQVTPNESRQERQPTMANPAPALGSIGVLPSSKASIARETELLASVQRALQQGRPATALSILSRYATEFPAGELQEEAIASRVVALCEFGRREDAARWRVEFFRRYPNSALSARVRAACPGTGGEK